jgi:lipopolysaccharide transport system permease protein
MASAPVNGARQTLDDVALTDAASPRRVAPHHFRDLVWHLARAELASTHRMTTLGWLWPLVRQLAQLAILVFVFSRLLHLGIKNFPVFVFSGLVAWNWFSAGVMRSSTALLEHRHLLFQPRFPSRVVPVVAIFVPLLDVVFALPVLLVMLIFSGGLSWGAFGLPLVLALQFFMMVGLAWWLAAASVFFRDIPNLVGVVLLLLFYLTPVFYSHHSIPSRYAWILQLNPMTVVIDATRSLLLSSSAPDWPALALLFLFDIVLVTSAYVVFGRLQGRFVDFL